GKTRAEVADKLSATLSDQKKGIPIITERQTVGQFLDRWLEDCVKPTVRPNTYDSYEVHVRLYLKPDLGRIQLDKLSPQQVEAFLNAQVKAGRSPRMAQYLRSVLRIALNQAMKWNLVVRNAAGLVDPPRYIKPEIEPFSIEQVQAFMDASKGDRLELLFLVMLSMGLRKGEATALRWQDVDMNSGVMRVQRSLQRIEKKYQLVELKTKRSRRTLPMPEKVITALRTHRTRQLEERLLAAERWKDSGFVFTTSVGTPLNPRNVLRSFHRLLEKAGIPRRGVHNLRHTCASLLLEQNVHARTLMDILGHSRISVTMDTYAHVMPPTILDAANLMNSVISGRG
ncbi:MAG TPA: site-specific integrase, partial [Pyrinomonadaceae bacterium]|nr:site-specific integrase [Pyrinomonadaceae bacterium]